MRWITLLSLSLFLFPTSNRAYASERIGFVDLRKALNSVEDGRFAKKKLKAKKSRYQKLLSKAQRALKREKKTYDARATILRGRAKRKAQLSLQKKFLKLQQLYAKLTRKLAREESVETRKIFRKMERIIRGIARENRLILMLEKTESSILYAPASMDFTNELIRRYNRIYGKKGVKTSRRKRRKKRRRRKRRKK